MGAEGMVGIMAKKLFGDAAPPEDAKRELVKEIESTSTSTRSPAGVSSTT